MVNPMDLRMWALVTACLLFAVQAARADDDEMEPFTRELDSNVSFRVFDTHFARFGYEPLKSMRRDGDWLHFQLPAEVDKETGLYSYVGLAGDFEMEVSYSWNILPEPKPGRNISCGIAAEGVRSTGEVRLSRSFGTAPAKSGYAVRKRLPVDRKSIDKTEFYYAVSRFVPDGRLMLRRVKDEMICLASNNKGELQELDRFPFTPGTIRILRIYANPGASPTTGLDLRLGNFRLRAGEITGGFPVRERRGAFPWWLVSGTSFLAVAAGGWLIARRQRRKLLQQ
jgi:hypothetical protein